MAFENPFLKGFLVVLKGEIPVFCLFEDGDVARLGAAGIDEVGGAQRGAAFLTLVAVGSLGVTHGALTDNVAIGNEAACSLVIELHRGLLDEASLVINVAEELRCGLAMGLGGGAGIDIE